MTRDDVKKILMRIQTTYPNWKPQGDLSLMIDVWHEYLEGYSYEAILIALKTFVMTDYSGFAPGVGQLLEKLQLISQKEELTDLGAWALVSKALRNGYYGAEEEFAKLPPIVQKAVGSPMNLRNWATSDVKSVETVIMSQFLSTYKTECQRAAEMAKIPNSMRIGFQERLMIEGESNGS